MDESNDVIWTLITVNSIRDFDFLIYHVGINPHIVDNYIDKSSLSFFMFFVDTQARTS